jgi:hypothetical protein
VVGSILGSILEGCREIPDWLDDLFHRYPGLSRASCGHKSRAPSRLAPPVWDIQGVNLQAYTLRGQHKSAHNRIDLMRFKVSSHDVHI